MKKIFVITLLGFLMAANAQAADWTMFRKNAARTGYARETACDTLTFKWKYNTGKEIVSSPVVYDGVVYIGSRSGTLYAVNIFGDTAGGTLKWQFSSATGGYMDATPAVYNGIVYMPCADGKLYAINAKTGSVAWTKTTGGNDYSSPAVKDNVLYMGSGSPNREVLAINIWTGSTIWSYTTGQYVYSSPAVNGNAVYVGSNDGKLYSLDITDGSSRWGYQTGFITGGGFYFSSPLFSDPYVYTLPGDADWNIYSVNKDACSETWSYTVPGAGSTYVSSPALAGETLYFVSGLDNPTLYALNSEDGSLLWSGSIGAATGQRYLSSPAVAGDKIYVGASNGNIYRFDTSGNSEVFNVGDTYPIVSSVCVSNGMILFGSFNGYLYAYEAYTVGAISYPLDGGYAGGETIVIKGSATGYDFKRYSISCGYGSNPETWINIATDIETPVFNDELAQWGISGFGSGIYTMNLILERGDIIETSVILFTIDKAYTCTSVVAATGGTIQAQDGTKVIIPPGVLSNNDFIIISTPLSPPSVSDPTLNYTGIAREFSFGSSSTSLNGKVTIYIPYTHDAIAGMNENNLRMYEWSQSLGKWRAVSTSQVLTADNYVYAEVEHFSIYAIMEFVAGSTPLISKDTTYCYPNPARGVNMMTFKCFLGEAADINIYVYNIAGELVANLEKRNALSGVNNIIEWDITNIASGTYIYKVQAAPKSGAEVKTVIKKMAIIH